jgi:methylated-DNA-[protein]-cysteine S-methyltransferase
MTMHDFPAADRAVLDRLHARLVDAAAVEGTLDVSYRNLDSPLGRLLVAATPSGLVRLAFANESEEEVLATLAARVSPRVLRAPGRFDHVAGELDDYFAGRRRSFDLPLDLRLAQGFRRDVLAALPRIAYGTTASYKAVAASTGRPGAVRAVGTACAMNPLPIVIPCHRVVRSDGAMGGYRGGPAAKQTLLELEAAA